MFEVGKKYKGMTSTGTCLAVTDKGAIIRWGDGSEGYWPHTKQGEWQEIKPEIVRWVNIHNGWETIYKTRELADANAGRNKRLACVKVVCHEGDGL